MGTREPSGPAATAREFCGEKALSGNRKYEYASALVKVQDQCVGTQRRCLDGRSHPAQLPPSVGLVEAIIKTGSDCQELLIMATIVAGLHPRCAVL